MKTISVDRARISSETAQTMPRLFVALRPPAAVRDALLAIQGGVEGARWQDDDQFHLTVRYIGEVDGRTANDIADLLSGVTARPFEIALSGVGSFDKRGRTDTLWAGVAPLEPLAALHKKVDHALVRLGVPPEGRAYRPHITLARGRMGPVDGFLAGHGGLTGDLFEIRHFALYESIMGAGGSAYIEAARYALG
jgi:RNA 2',3'-cyclic 3'-phosphodiesterase